MPFRPRLTVTSAHAVAFAALVLAAGGGFAVAQNGAPAAPKAYSDGFDAPRVVKNGNATLLRQTVVAANRDDAATARLDLRRPAGAGGGAVTCHLGAIGDLTSGRTTLDPGKATTMTLTAFGTAQGGTTQAADLYCEGSTKNRYVVSNVRLTAIEVDATTLTP